MFFPLKASFVFLLSNLFTFCYISHLRLHSTYSFNFIVEIYILIWTQPFKYSFAFLPKNLSHMLPHPLHSKPLITNPQNATRWQHKYYTWSVLFLLETVTNVSSCLNKHLYSLMSYFLCQNTLISFIIRYGSNNINKIYNILLSLNSKLSNSKRLGATHNCQYLSECTKHAF